MMMMMMRGWKLYVRFWVDEYEANNEEREHCGVFHFHVKDTHISIHTYTSFEKTLRASLLCDYVRKRTQKRQRFCFPLTKATRRQNRSLSLCLFVSLFAYSRLGRPVELLTSQEEEEEEESQSESESKSSSSSQGGHLFSYKYCTQSE